MTTPDVIVRNADIRTMDGLVPKAQALAIKDGCVLALGSNDDMAHARGPGTRVVEAGGRLVLPGFQDTHIHLQDGGQRFAQTADLTRARTVEALQKVLRDEAGKGNGWVNGGGWYSGIFSEDNLDRHVLDAAVPDRPCYIVSSDGHNACINSLACERIGLRRGTPDPLNGQFVRDRNGEPTGMLYESAMDWAEERMPRPSEDDFAEGVRYGQALCNRHGITGIIDASVEERHARVYRRLDREGGLTVRVGATAKVHPHEGVAEAIARLSEMRAESAGDMLAIHSAKFFLDGVLENRTAAMLEPYSDAAGGNAPLMFDFDHMKALFAAFDAARFQIHVHAIGDAAVRASLDGLEHARRLNGAWPSLHQIAHIQCIDPADIPRFRELGAMANIQSLWARHEPSVCDVAMPMVGSERGRLMYAFRSLIDAGASCALSSDWGVSTLNPFEIMETGVTRQPPGRPSSPVFHPEQRMTIEECVRGYTLAAAAAAWRAGGTGTLGVGKQADLIILDRDIFSCPSHEIGATSVLLTLVSGNEVYRAGSFDG